MQAHLSELLGVINDISTKILNHNDYNMLLPYTQGILTSLSEDLELEIKAVEKQEASRICPRCHPLDLS
jgi:hypothetical protein